MAFGLSSTAASAAESGSVAIDVVAPTQVALVNDLRFGAILQAATAGTLRIRPNGNVSATGGVVGGYAIPQPPSGRGPAKFRVVGDPNRFIHATLPNSITISNGPATMLVDLIQSNTFFGFGWIGASGETDLDVGGRLNVGASQASGFYTGTFEISVLYF